MVRITLATIGAFLLGALLFQAPLKGRPTYTTDPPIVITPILHSSVQIEIGSQVIQVDPWSRGDLTRAKPADLILITDDPAHHMDPAAIRQLRKPGAPVLLTAATQSKFPEGFVIANGETKTIAGITVEAIPSYDIKPGEPSHPKGKSNGYLISVGGKRIFLAGVTECVSEIRALRDIDIAFMPMNLPLERMMPAATAECVIALKPKVVYVYHYDQNYERGTTNPAAIAASLQAFRDALKGQSIAFIQSDWYWAAR